MKKIISTVFAITIVFGIGTGVLANSEQLACKVKDFKEMLPFMQEKHPDLNEKELKEMHKNCVTIMKNNKADNITN